MGNKLAWVFSQASLERRLAYVVVGLAIISTLILIVVRHEQAPTSAPASGSSSLEGLQGPPIINALAVSPDGERVAFVSRGHLVVREEVRVSSTIGIMRLERGAEPEWINTHLSVLSPPAWSPDAAAIAFVGWDEEAATTKYIVTYDLHTKAFRTFATYVGDLGMACGWSPTGRWIAFVCKPFGVSTSGGWDLAIVHPDGTGAHNITNNGLVKPALAVHWSPDGSQLYYVRKYSPSSNIGDVYLKNIQAPGKPERRVTNNLSVMHIVALSRDGQYLLCRVRGAWQSSTHTYQSSVCLIPVAYPARIRVVLHESSNPVFSPATEWIAFLDNEGSSIPGSFELWKMALLDTGKKVKLAEGVSGLAWRNAWTPQGQIVFTRDGYRSLWTINDDGSNEREIFTLSGN